jgi:hypothetical protein
MDARTKLNLMVAAMIGDDDWVALVEDEIAREDSIEWLFAPVEDETDDYEDDMLDREFWAKGQW